MTIRNLDRLFRPRSVVMIGASPRSGSVGHATTKNLLSAGFDGDVYLVNPKYDEIDGHACFGSIGELPGRPDLGVIATPAATVPDLVSELGAAGARAAVCISGGLSSDLKQQMLDAARPNCLRVLGPNCVGLQVPERGLNASFAHRHAPRGDIAFISQSGALVTAIIDWAADRGIGFSHVISSGDMADVDFGDLLDYLAGDSASRAILIYMEALTNAAKFMSAVRRAARAKPVILIKTGRSDAAAKAAMSHTGALAGADAVYDAAFRRSGVVRVDDLEQLFEAAEIIRMSGRLKGQRLAIVTNGGGAGVLAMDRLAGLGGEAAELDEATLAALNKVLPPTWSKSNPIDIIGDADAERYKKALAIVSGSSDCDAVLAIYCPTAVTSGIEIAQSVTELSKSKGGAKPILTNWLGDTAVRPSRELFTANQVPTFETPGSAVRAFMHLVHYRRAQDELMQTPPARLERRSNDVDGAAKVIKDIVRSGRTILSAHEAKSVLAAYGIPIVSSEIVADVKDINQAAERLLSVNPSVALKIQSDDISHKSDAGGVCLNLSTSADVERAAMEMLERISNSHPEAYISGFSLEPMVTKPNGVELIIGVSVDETFGPTIMFGAGGTAVEVTKDTAISLLPIDYRLAQELVDRTRVRNLLAGYRDRPAANFDAICSALYSVSQLAIDHPEIRELDINPLVADENGVVVLDARIRVADQRSVPRHPLSIRPYPKEWEREIENPELGKVLIRPIIPQDEQLYPRFGEQLTTDDIRLRLFSTPKVLSHQFLARMTQIDYAREMAFVALESDSGELLGITRLIADPDYERGEYAIITRSDIQGRGLGWQLMQHLIQYAKSEGLIEIFGSVLAVNTTMLKMCKELGFEIEANPEDLTVRYVKLDVATASASKS